MQDFICVVCKVKLVECSLVPRPLPDFIS